MANYLSDRTGASIDTVLDNADAGNIGKAVVSNFTGDLNTLKTIGFYAFSSSVTNSPIVTNGTISVSLLDANRVSQTLVSSTTIPVTMFFRSSNGGVWQPWQELYHTGNTGVVEYSDSGPAPGAVTFRFFETLGGAYIGNSGVGSSSALVFSNDNGQVGSVATSGTATAYNTSSDPRLKDFAEAPTDSAINAEFNSLFSCFRTFNWKNDPQGDLVWGFDAHACVDANLDMGSEGEGSRSLNLGDVYETIPAVTENRVVNDAEGNPTSEIETVIITAAIEKKVSPAGVDQSKAVPILLAKIEQLERRLTAAGL